MSTRRGFISPETVKKDLPGGGWIEVKKRLTHGEVQALRFNSWGKIGMKFDDNADAPEMVLDMALANNMRMLTWICAWGLVDENDRPVAVTLEAIEALDPDVASEIDQVLTAHIAEMEALKNALTPGETRT